jgi:hypothetical protein
VYIIYQLLDISVQAAYMYKQQSWILFHVLDILVDVSIIWVVTFFIKAIARISPEDVHGLQRANRGAQIHIV